MKARKTKPAPKAARSPNKWPRAARPTWGDSQAIAMPLWRLMFNREKQA